LIPPPFVSTGLQRCLTRRRPISFGGEVNWSATDTVVGTNEGVPGLRQSVGSDPRSSGAAARRERVFHQKSAAWLLFESCACFHL
jgi:hypothetical protein